MLESGEAILAYTKGGKTRFLDDRMVQSAVERRFELMGLAAKRVSSATMEANPTIPWRSIIALGDVLLRATTMMEPEKMWAAIAGPLKETVPVLRRMAGSP
jgi:uncharacterized protein with HEPN domain